MLDKKGIFAYLAIAFGLTYAIEIPALLSGFRLDNLTSSVGTYIFLPIMVFPALAAYVTARFITHEGKAALGLRFGPWKPYLLNALLFPVLFLLVYALTWALGLGQPDWNLAYFKSTFSANNVAMPPMPDTRLVLLGVFAASLTVGALVNWLWCTGEEIGWRGYLLPKLMPLGKTRAYLLLGLIWSVWHWPLLWMGFAYNRPHSVLALVAFTGLTTGLGMYLNELALRHKSAILAGWVHGVFNTQKVGVWFFLFPVVDPYLGGYAGLVGLVIWFALAAWEMRKTKAAPGASVNSQTPQPLE